MFWRVASGTVSSPIVAILEKEDFTLEELLEEGELVEEIQEPNRKLVDFLIKQSTVEALLHYVVDEPDETVNEAARLKVPFEACEVLCCESDEILDALVSTSANFTLLFSPATRDTRQTDSGTANLFARVVANLMARRGSQLYTWLKGNIEVLEGLADRLETTGTAEVLARLVGADEETAAMMPVQQLSWIAETQVLNKLFAKLEDNEDASTTENAAEVLAAIARARMSPLTHLLGSHDSVQRLVTRAVDASQGQIFIQALNICIALVERGHLWATQEGVLSLPADLDRELEEQVVNSLAPHASHLLTHLSISQNEKRQETPYGVLQPSLGSARLTVIALLAVLLRTGLSAAEEAVMDANLMQTCLTLFTSYPFNSILHHQVALIISSILENGSDVLVEHLFKDCKLLSWLVECPLLIHPLPLEGDERAKTRPPLAAGYSGHLTQIGNKIAATADARPLVSEFLVNHTGWQEFASGRLARANQMEDVEAWECGRPKVRVGFGEGGSPDLDNGEFARWDLGASQSYSSYDNNLDDDEEGYHQSDSLFADAPYAGDDDYNTMSPSLRTIMNNMSEDAKDGGRIPSDVFNQTMRDFSSIDDDDDDDDVAHELTRDGFNIHITNPPPETSAGDLELEDEQPGSDSGANGLQREGAPGLDLEGIVNNWEDLVDADSSPTPPHRLTPRPATSAGDESTHAGGSSPLDRPPGSPLFSLDAAGSASPQQRRAIQKALQAAMDTAQGSTTASQPQYSSESIEGASRKESEILSQGTSAGAGTTSVSRKMSNDLDSHPLSGESSMDMEDLTAETSAIDLVEAPSGIGLDPSNGAEEETLVGSFTKLDMGSAAEDNEGLGLTTARVDKNGRGDGRSCVGKVRRLLHDAPQEERLLPVSDSS